MATATCTSLKFKFYNGGWSSWYTSKGGYAGKHVDTGKMCVYVIQFTTPSISTPYHSGKLKVQVPFVRDLAASATSGTFYIKLFTSESDATATNNPSGAQASVTWSSTNRQYWTETFEISTNSLAANTNYWVVIWANNKAIQVGPGDASNKFAITLNYTHYTNGSATCKIADTTRNTFTISGTVTAGTGNAFKSGTIYWTTDGSDPSTSNYKGKSSITVSDSAYSHTEQAITAATTVKAYLNYVFNHNSGNTAIASKAITYHALGKNGSVTIKDNNNNTFSIAAKNPTAGTNNSITSSVLYYKIGSGTEKSVTLSTDASATVTKGPYSITTTSSIAARIVTTYQYAINASGSNTVTTNATTTTITYHGQIGAPSVSITDNHNNTFTITGTDAKDGTNNAATTSYVWGYSTSYGNSGAGTKAITTTADNGSTAAFKVYAKATATSAYCNQTTTATAGPVEVKHYVVPTDPGKPILSYTKNRLTIKEPWTFNWPASTAANTSSPLKGYYVMLRRCPAGKDASVESNWEFIRNIACSTSNDYITPATSVNTDTTTNYFTRRANTSCTVIIQNPAEFGFVPGDHVALRVRAYTVNGKDAVMQSTNYATSDSAMIQNAGIVHVKPDGSWKEGQVWVKVDGKWKEAETVNVKVDGTWKESQ